jgi:ribonucleoside-diphosphate reductase alpha chain
MIDLRLSSPFIELAAVESWDAWFRWREQGDLRDLSIEDTWRRVAGPLASVEARGDIAQWQSRFMRAFTSWQLLPDEQVLANAGTGRPLLRGDTLHAVLNAAGFVTVETAAASAPDLAGLSDCATLAVRVLDNAALLAGVARPHLRIGIIGVADALALADVGYDSDSGRAQAASMAEALATGCLRGSMLLAIERGPRGDGDARAAIERAELRGMPAELLRDAAGHGLRYTQLTAITSRPRLALLANDVANAADPLRGENHANVIAVGDEQRLVRSSGFALSMLRTRSTASAAGHDMPANLSREAQIAMRAALQPWIDEPIVYPLQATFDPEDLQRNPPSKVTTAHGPG